MDKNLYLIRHGHSLHNELFHKIGVEAFRIPLTIDSPLTNEGHLQSIELGNTWQKKREIELILVSPLTRTLDTAMNIFGDTDIPMISQEFLREYPIGEDTCNKRSSLTLLKNKYPKVDFHLITDQDTLWTSDYRETIDELEQRLDQMVKYLQNRKYIDDEGNSQTLIPDRVGKEYTVDNEDFTVSFKVEQVNNNLKWVPLVTYK